MFIFSTLPITNLSCYDLFVASCSESCSDSSLSVSAEISRAVDEFCSLSYMWQVKLVNGSIDTKVLKLICIFCILRGLNTVDF